VGPYTPTVDKIADQYIRQIRIMLPRDKFLQERKRQLLQAINLFEKTHKYTGHLIIDVDPI
jgi:primosomal protein N'